MLANCESKLRHVVLPALKDALLVTKDQDIEHIRSIWEICRGLGMAEEAGKLHTEVVTETASKKAKQLVVQIKMLHSMANLKFVGSDTKVKVTSDSDQQPHVTAISTLIGEVRWNVSLKQSWSLFHGAMTAVPLRLRGGCM